MQKVRGKGEKPLWSTKVVKGTPSPQRPKTLTRCECLGEKIGFEACWGIHRDTLDGRTA